MHSRGGACLAGGCALQGECVQARPPANNTRYGDTVKERAVRILLECILVFPLSERFVGVEGYWLRGEKTLIRDRSTEHAELITKLGRRVVCVSTV